MNTPRANIDMSILRLLVEYQQFYCLIIKKKAKTMIAKDVGNSLRGLPIKYLLFECKQINGEAI